MFIKLTNASPNYANKPIILKKELIVSVYEGTVAEEVDGVVTEKPVTCVYGPPHGEWQVMESIDQVFKLINK